MKTDQYAADLDSILQDRSTERWFRAVAEEAGEVVGAYNKMDYTGHPKQKNADDVLEEMGQLLGCMIICAQRLGFTYEQLLAETERFCTSKKAQILAFRATRETM